MQTWLFLILSLPTENATLRMRVWRALKALGCANLRDGVYLLPATPDHEASLLALAEELVEGGGIAQVRQSQELPPDELGFDFDGATFTHVDKHVTFEVLLTSFGLEHDSALVNISAVCITWMAVACR